MKERIKQSGISLYNEQIKDAQDILAYGFKDDVSYNPNIVIYKTTKSVPIKIYDQKYNASYGVISKFLSPHIMPIELGEIFYDTKKNEYWLCIESYNVSEIHYEGKLGKCGRFIKWQENDGTIQEIPVITRNATQYNNGEYKDGIITLGSDQVLLYTQLNEHTCKLDHGVKFILDENKENPTVYQLTKPDTVDYSYMGKGLISLMLTEYSYKPSKKELEMGVCNYFDPSTSFLSKLDSDERVLLNAIISGVKKLKVGFPRTYTVNFINKNKDKIDWTEIDFKWEIISDFDIKTNIYENKIDILVNDENYIGSSFLLKVIVENNISSEMNILITSIA